MIQSVLIRRIRGRFYVSKILCIDITSVSAGRGFLL